MLGGPHEERLWKSPPRAKRIAGQEIKWTMLLKKRNLQVFVVRTINWKDTFYEYKCKANAWSETKVFPGFLSESVYQNLSRWKKPEFIPSMITVKFLPIKQFDPTENSTRTMPSSLLSIPNPTSHVINLHIFSSNPQYFYNINILTQYPKFNTINSKTKKPAWYA